MASVSPTASRTRFCTEVALPSPKRRSSSFASCPSSSPNTSANCSLEELGDRARLLGELLLDVLRGLLELGLDELGVRAGLLAVEHARADLDGVAHDLDRVVAVLLALTHQPDGAFVLDDEAVDDQRDRPIVRTWGCLRGVAASIDLEPPTRRPGVRRNGDQACSQASGKTLGVCPG